MSDQAGQAFERTADVYDTLYHFKDYGAATDYVSRVVQRHAPHARTLLDVGCGTGRHLELLRTRFDVCGLDANRRMLARARRRCPDIEFHEADMTDFALGATFDVVVCLFSSIGYVRTAARMRRAIVAMSRHLAPRGVLLVEPWFTPDTYWVDRVTVNVTPEEPRIAWMYTSKRRGRLAILDIHYLVGDRRGVNHLRERHELGLFTDNEYSNAFRRAGLEVLREDPGPFGRGLYVGISRVHP